ncbi:MAG: glycosyltransferase, partial [Luteimonas sp.]|nr:glycosyltransferase [Luteimonas sp.]
GHLRADGVDARLWMPGAREPGRERYVADLEAKVSLGGFADTLAITPPTSAMAEAYAASDLVLQLSRKPESFGRTVVEALSVGRPVVGWDHGGVGELLRALQPAGAVAPFDARALLAASRAAIDDPSPLPATIPFTLRAMQDATLSIYDELRDDPRAER